jgi:hypothetical protein
MPTYSGNNGAFTPATNADNWTIDSQSSGVYGKVVEFGWGGRLTTSTAYRTRWTRPTTIGSGAFTALTMAFNSPNYITPGSRFGTFATQPVLAADPAGNLHAQDWNANGGLGYIVLPLNDPWRYVNGVLTGQISCRNIQGTDASGSSYTVAFEED